MLELALLGPLVLRRAGQALPLAIKKTQALLVLLALLPRGATLPRSRAVALLWPPLDESTGRRNLRRELARLREVGGPGVVQAVATFWHWPQTCTATCSASSSSWLPAAVC
jgi:DNA-binding SARP family transcriptional activator